MYMRILIQKEIFFAHLYETIGEPPSEGDGVHPRVIEEGVVENTPRVGGAGGTPLLRLTEK